MIPDCMPITKLADAIGIPFSDIDVALVSVPTETRTNQRIYHLGLALPAIRAYYHKRLSEHMDRYRETNKHVYLERAQRMSARGKAAKALEDKWRAQSYE